MVDRSEGEVPRPGFAAETGRFVAVDVLITTLFVFSLAPSFYSFRPSLSRYVSLLRVGRSVQQSSAPLKQVRVALVSSVFCLISYFLLFYLLNILRN